MNNCRHWWRRRTQQTDGKRCTPCILERYELWNTEQWFGQLLKNHSDTLLDHDWKGE